MNEKKKIFFVGSDMPYPGNTGGSAINWSVINYLTKRGHNLTVFCGPPSGGSVISETLSKEIYSKAKTLNCELITLGHLKKDIKKKIFLKEIFQIKLKITMQNVITLMR